ncbi:hypothetical protein UYSO10_3887 [Kosakonia radicincitans]|nr:hypothetical protein UYSO10_3887 [Kosakonia radicincitans]
MFRTDAAVAMVTAVASLTIAAFNCTLNRAPSALHRFVAAISSNDG